MKIILPFPVSVNAAYGGGSGQKRFKTKAYKAWLEKCPNISERITEYPIHITYIYAWPDARQRDGGNYQKIPLDFLVSQGVITDDSYQYVASEDWQHIGIDRQNPRVEIIIKKI